MKALLSRIRYVAYVPVVMTLLASVAAFLWGAARTAELVYHLALLAGGAGGHVSHVEFIAIMDLFLIATALLIFALGLYELFIEEIDYPEWLVIKDLHSLKAKLASVIVLVMAVAFLEHLSKWRDALDTLMYAAAIALVSGALIAFSHYGGKD